MDSLRKYVGIAACSVFMLAACGGSTGNDSTCGPVVNQERLITQFTASLMRYEKPIDPVVQEIPKVLAPNESPTWNRFSIALRATYQTYSVQIEPRIEFSLFEQANACSIVIKGKQRITKMSITSANNFSASYPAGSELLNLFAWVDNDYLSLTTLLLNQPSPLDFEIKLRESPQFARQNFTIQIGLDDGSSFTLNTGDVYFTLL